MPAYNDRTALIVVDIQNDFADPDGSLAVSGAERVVDYANRAIADARDAGALVLCTQDWHPEHTPHFEPDGGLWPVHCVGDDWGAELHPALDAAGALIVRKGVDGNDGYSGFTTRDPNSGAHSSTMLETFLRVRGIERAVIIGLATDYCVKETALDALRLGFAVTVPTDGVAAVNLQTGDGDAALRTMTEAGAAIE